MPDAIFILNRTEDHLQIQREAWRMRCVFLCDNNYFVVVCDALCDILMFLGFYCFLLSAFHWSVSTTSTVALPVWIIPFHVIPIHSRLSVLWWILSLVPFRRQRFVGCLFVCLFVLSSCSNTPHTIVVFVVQSIISWNSLFFCLFVLPSTVLQVSACIRQRRWEWWQTTVHRRRVVGVHAWSEEVGWTWTSKYCRGQKKN